MNSKAGGNDAAELEKLGYKQVWLGGAARWRCLDLRPPPGPALALSSTLALPEAPSHFLTLPAHTARTGTCTPPQHLPQLRGKYLRRAIKGVGAASDIRAAAASRSHAWCSKQRFHLLPAACHAWLQRLSVSAHRSHEHTPLHTRRCASAS